MVVLGCSGTHIGNEPRAATEGTESQQGNHNAFALGWLSLPKASTDAERVAVGVVGSAMSVAPIDANALALVGSLSRKCPRMRNGCRSSDGCPCLGCSGTLRGKEPEAATKGKESQQGNRNALALVVPELSERERAKSRNKAGKNIVLQLVV